MCQFMLHDARCGYEVQRDELLAKLQAVNSASAALRVRLDHALAELAELRPPEPKFKVGQIVVTKVSFRGTGTAFTIRKARLNAYGKWQYSNNRLDEYQRNWVMEDDLRAQTPEEAGIENAV